MSYRVDVPGRLLQRLRDLHREAVRAGQEVPFEDGVRSLYRRLEANPAAVGEITYRTKLDDPVHVVAEGPVSFNFVIHAATSVVWVTKIERLLARHE